MLGSRCFGDAQLEQLYREKQLKSTSIALLYSLFVLGAALLLFAVNHLSDPDLALIFAVIGAALALIFNILLFIASEKAKHTVISFVVVWLFAVVTATVLAGGQSALIPSVIAYFLLYTVFCYDFPTTTFFAVSLALVQVVGFVLLPLSPFTIHQLLATLLVHGWCNFIGIYLYVTKDRIMRAGFLNSRNALMSQMESERASEKMGRLLGSALPEHVIATVSSQINVNIPRLFIEHYSNTAVIFAKIYGLEAILGQISVPDTARLLNEFNSKIDLLVKRNNLVRIQSDAIVVVSGVPQLSNECSEDACQFAWELVHLLRSFSEATATDLYVKVGVAVGSLSTGIVGANKWHYEIIGEAYNNAILLERKAAPGQILLTPTTAKLVEATYGSEQLDETTWRLIPTARVVSTIPNGMMFPFHRRFSVSTVSQAVNRLLIATNVVPMNTQQNESLMMSSCGTEKGILQGWRKKKTVDFIDQKYDEEVEGAIIKKWTLRFCDPQIEKSYNMVIDRWFIPALAISIFFLVTYGLYQVLVMPRLILTLALIIVALAVMFVILLMLYVNYFESFCQFITRTFVGHAVVILVIITLHLICGAVNVFSCPPLKINPVCHNVYYSVMSCVLWMLSTTVFIRCNSLILLGTLLAGIVVYSIQIFVTHSDIYISFSILAGWRVEFDIIIALVTFAVLIYLQARRNERVIRLDFLSLLRSVDEAAQLERCENGNDQILLNFLPHHIAYNYLHRTDPYCQLCQSVGVLSAQIGNADDWSGEQGIIKLNGLIYQIDRLVEIYPGIEKVRSSHCVYTAAVGVLPEITRNIHDTPFTIGDLLASLTDFGLRVKQLIENEGLDIRIGIDCGSALSVVIGGERPRYEVLGLPCIRANQLMDAAYDYGIIVSEEIYLALRPRNFNFAHNYTLKIAPQLSGYVFATSLLTKGLGNDQRNTCNLANDVKKDALEIQLRHTVNTNEDIQSTNLMADQSSPSSPPHDPHHIIRSVPVNAKSVGMTAHNPLEMFTSMNSSMSSDVYSIDLSIESDSEIEWVTPELLRYEKADNQQMRTKDAPHLQDRFRSLTPSIHYRCDRAKQYSDFSENEHQEHFFNWSSKMRRKRYRPSLSRNGPRIPNWLSSRGSLNSDRSLHRSQDDSTTALERLNSAATRVDKMLRELAHVDDNSNNPLQKPFPITVSATSTKSISIDNRRELSSACQTEYDNAESDGAASDSEMATTKRLEALRCILRGFRNNKSEDKLNIRQQTERFLNRGMRRAVDNGNEADIDSNCSSLAASAMFEHKKWKSVHSIGYENEYEYISDNENERRSIATSPQLSITEQNFLLIDVDDTEADTGQVNENSSETVSTRLEMEALSRDICKNFGEFQLASFSDMDISK